MNLKKKSGMILGGAGVVSSHFYKHLLNGGCWVISVIDNSLLRKKLKQIYSDVSLQSMSLYFRKRKLYLCL